MTNKKRTGIFLVVLLTIVLLTVVVLASLPGSAMNQLTSPASGALQPFFTIVQKSTEGVTNFFRSIRDGMAIQEENKLLRQENAELRNKLSQNEEAVLQYQELKEAFQLKDAYAEYDIVAARVLNHEIGVGFDLFRIGLGTMDGIRATQELSYAVVDAESRLVGRVMSSDLTSSKVLPLSHSGFSVSGKVDVVKGALVRVRGDLAEQINGRLIIDQIPRNARIMPGDRLVTSGSGGLFPAGLLIGTIDEVRINETNLEQTATLIPATDMMDLSVVFVMRGKQ